MLFSVTGGREHWYLSKEAPYQERKTFLIVFEQSSFQVKSWCWKNQDLKISKQSKSDLSAPKNVIQQNHIIQLIATRIWIKVQILIAIVVPFVYHCDVKKIYNWVKLDLIWFEYIECFMTTFLHTHYSLLAKLGRWGWGWLERKPRRHYRYIHVHQNKTRSTGSHYWELQTQASSWGEIPARWRLQPGL